ncbi:MAG: class I SAM-dependent methyltransferase [Candidatus Limivivens sp.]|nr:class I SAM-dependent methyltransferase [Candidatus Limivivens sp.]
MESYQITQWCHHFIKEHVKSGDFCIDATMGNGHDTLLLSVLAGPEGHVLAFDVQEAALEHTRIRLKEANAPANYELLLESHTEMGQYAQPDSVSCIVFNFGYLPGGDHQKATRAETSLTAIRTGLLLLRSGGLMSLCIYSGGDTGFDERDTILRFLEGLNPREYLVIQSLYLNRPNHPPVPVLIIKR